jgi:hypothetical protein
MKFNTNYSHKDLANLLEYKIDKKLHLTASLLMIFNGFVSYVALKDIITTLNSIIAAVVIFPWFTIYIGSWISYQWRRVRNKGKSIEIVESGLIIDSNKKKDWSYFFSVETSPQYIILYRKIALFEVWRIVIIRTYLDLDGDWPKIQKLVHERFPTHKNKDLLFYIALIILFLSNITLLFSTK